MSRWCEPVQSFSKDPSLLSRKPEQFNDYRESRECYVSAKELLDSDEVAVFHKLQFEWYREC